MYRCCRLTERHGTSDQKTLPGRSPYRVAGEVGRTSRGLEPVTSDVTAPAPTAGHRADPGQSGSAVPRPGRSMAIVDAGCRKTCKALAKLVARFTSTTSSETST